MNVRLKKNKKPNGPLLGINLSPTEHLTSIDPLGLTCLVVIECYVHHTSTSENIITASTTHSICEFVHHMLPCVFSCTLSFVTTLEEKPRKGKAMFYL